MNIKILIIGGKDNQGKKWYWLTEKGRKVAEYLMKIEEVMEEG